MSRWALASSLPEIPVPVFVGALVVSLSLGVFRPRVALAAALLALPALMLTATRLRDLHALPVTLTAAAAAAVLAVGAARSMRRSASRTRTSSVSSSLLSRTFVGELKVQSVGQRVAAALVWSLCAFLVQPVALLLMVAIDPAGLDECAAVATSVGVQRAHVAIGCLAVAVPLAIAIWRIRGWLLAAAVVQCGLYGLVWAAFLGGSQNC